MHKFDLDRRPLHRAWISVESWVAGLFSVMMCLCFGPLIFGIATTSALQSNHPWRWALPTLVGAFALLDLAAILILLTSLLRGQFPVALAGAARQPNWPLPIRPLVCIYWLAHFAVAAHFAFLAERVIMHGQTEWKWMPFIFAAGYCVTYASNTFLLMAVGAVSRSARQVLWLWKWRLGVDLIAIGLFTLLHRVLGTELGRGG